MLRNMTRRFCRAGLLAALAASFAFIVISTSTGVQAQKVRKVTGAPQISEPLYRDYRGVTIGMSPQEVHSKLGEPKETSGGQDFYSRSDNEFVQVFYDYAKKVKAVVVTYVGEASQAPSCKEVFGEEVLAADDGSMNKLVRYPRTGYWVAYHRTGGTDPITTVTIQKFQE